LYSTKRNFEKKEVKDYAEIYFMEEKNKPVKLGQPNLRVAPVVSRGNLVLCNSFRTCVTL